MTSRFPSTCAESGKTIPKGAEILQGLTPEWRENARLIAAAPELFVMIKDGAFQFSRLSGENLETYARTFSALARAALAKAEGNA